MNKKKKNTKKINLKNNPKLIGIIVVGIIAVAGFGILLGTQLLVDLDPGDGGEITITTGDENGETTFDVPEVSLNSAEIKDLDEESFQFEVFVTYRSSVSNMDVDFFVDGSFSFRDTLTYLGSGFYGDSYSKSQFSGADTDSVITLDIYMTYYHPIDLVSYVVPYHNVVDEFSFVYTEEPTYTAPEIIEGTFQATVEDVMVIFSFAISDFEHINSISYYFVVDDEIVKDTIGQDIVIVMTSDTNGLYSSLFDYTEFDLEKTTYIYLTMNFVNEESEEEDRFYEEFSYFGGLENTNTETGTGTESETSEAGINHIFVIITTAVALSTLTIIFKRKGKN